MFSAMLYRANRCQLVAGGTRHAGFELQAGIRQGCPLSPLLFAVASDVLLRRLQRLVPEATFRAYADDLAAELPRGLPQLLLVEPIFEEFARLSGLRLNLPKVVAVPLWLTPLDALRAEWAGRIPGWVGMRVALSAKYLGFMLGPGRGRSSWDGPLRKYSERAAAWGQAGAGLMLTALAYSVYVVSVLSFVLQLEPLPPQWPKVEAAACRRLVRGPGNWCLPTDIKTLQELGLPRGFASLPEISWATRLRVAYLGAGGQLRVQARAAALRQHILNAD